MKACAGGREGADQMKLWWVAVPIIGGVEMQRGCTDLLLPLPLADPAGASLAQTYLPLWESHSARSSVVPLTTTSTRQKLLLISSFFCRRLLMISGSRQRGQIGVCLREAEPSPILLLLRFRQSLHGRAETEMQPHKCRKVFQKTARPPRHLHSPHSTI